MTGVGAISSFGPGAPAFFDGLLTGASAPRPVTLFPGGRYRARLAGEVAHVPEDGEGRTRERAHLVALAAASEAVRDAEVDLAGPRTAVVAGTTLGGNLLYTAWLDARSRGEGVPAPAQDGMASATDLLASRWDVRGPCLTVSVACASGTAAVGLALLLLRRGVVDRALAGGYDALSEFVFSGFDSLRALSPSAARPFDRRRDGLTLGEGAGFLVLESARAAAERGARVRAWVLGYGSGADAHHMTRPSPSGEGLVRAVLSALADARTSPSGIAAVNAHGTATVFNDRMEANAFRAVFGEGVATLPVDSIKGAVGHTLGAAGALEAVMAVRALETGLFPPTAGFAEADPECPLHVVAAAPRELPRGPVRILSTSSAFAGTNAAIVLERA